MNNNENAEYNNTLHFHVYNILCLHIIDNLTSMGDGQGHMMMTPEKIEAFYKAQCLKDDTMSESIVEFLKEHKDTKVLHVQGSFHGDEHLGVVEKVNKLNPSLKTIVITPIEAKDYEKMKHNYGEDTIIMTFVRK